MENRSPMNTAASKAQDAVAEAPGPALQQDRIPAVYRGDDATASHHLEGCGANWR